MKKLTNKQIKFIKENYTDRINEFINSLIFFGDTAINIDHIAELVYYELLVEEIL